MSDLKDKFENAKDKFIGKTKEALGKSTGSERTELEGKLQSKKADLKENLVIPRRSLQERLMTSWIKRTETTSWDR